ncbi:hypothetical protein JCM10450v2_005347 [Rhodotorula kratochvilovae]
MPPKVRKPPPRPSLRVPKTTRCVLPLLPPDVLRIVFLRYEAIDFGNFLICKALLPHTLAALYNNVTLLSVDQLGEFCSILRHRPSLAQLVSSLVLVPVTSFEMRPEENPWHSAWGNRGAGQLARTQKELEVQNNHSYVPSAVILGPGLLKDLCRILPLRQLRVLGGHLRRALLSRPYLESSPLPQLAILELIASLDSLGADFHEPDDYAIFHNLALVPSLRGLAVLGQTRRLPIHCLNLAPATYLTPRTLFLDTVSLPDLVFLGPEARVLFSALRPGLRSLTLSALTFYPSIMDDLLRLPPTVDLLSLQLGNSCPSFVAPSTPPTFSSPSLALALPTLRHLHLSGPLLSPSTFPNVIHRLPALHCLSLGAHAQVDGAQLLSLLRGGPPSWPKIRTLTLNICACGSAPPPAAASAAAAVPARFRDRQAKPATAAARSAPRWPPGLSAADVREFARVAATREVDLAGTALCAAGLCGGDGAWGHSCPPAWA